MFGSIVTPTFIGPVLSLTGLVASQAGKPALGTLLADPAIVGDVVDALTALEVVFEKAVDFYGRLKAVLA